MKNKEIQQESEDYIRINNIEKNTYQVMKAFVDGGKFVRDTLGEKVELLDIKKQINLLTDFADCIQSDTTNMCYTSEQWVEIYLEGNL